MVPQGRALRKSRGQVEARKPVNLAPKLEVPELIEEIGFDVREPLIM